MASQRGRRASWGAAAMLAPGAAVVFSATISWAATSTPTTMTTHPIVCAPLTTNRPTTSAVARRSLSADARRWHAVAASRQNERVALTHQLAALRRTLHALHAANLAAARAGASAAAHPAAGGGSTGQLSGGTNPGSSGQGTTTQGGTAPTVVLPAPRVVTVPPPVVAPAPPVAAPPATHAATGSSGKP